MELIITLVLGILLGAFTQYNYMLWQGIVKLVSFGLYNVKSINVRKNIGKVETSGDLITSVDNTHESALNNISIISLNDLLNKSGNRNDMITLEKGRRYQIFIKFKLLIKNASA
jgi:hypothetical protein